MPKAYTTHTCMFWEWRAQVGIPRSLFQMLLLNSCPFVPVVGVRREAGPTRQLHSPSTGFGHMGCPLGSWKLGLLRPSKSLWVTATLVGATWGWRPLVGGG